MSSSQRVCQNMDNFTYSLLDFPVEILCEITRHAGLGAFLPLMLTHPQFNEVIRGNLLYLFGMGPEVRAFEKKSGFKAHMEQVLMLHALKKAHQRWNLVRAPMGCGKTAIMLMLALERPGRTILVINTRIYTSWIQEIKNFGLRLEQDPMMSDLLMIHTKYPKHRDSLLKNWESDPIDKKIVVTTTHFLSRYPHYNRLRGWVAGSTFQKNHPHWMNYGHLEIADPTAPQGAIIMDEAHLIKQPQMSFMNKVPTARSFLFSASPINITGIPPADLFKYTIFSRSTKGYPKLGFTRIQERKSLKDSLSEMVNRKKFNYTHVVVFSNFAAKTLRQIGLALGGGPKKKGTKKKDLPDKPPPIGSHKILTFSNTAPTILERWRKAKKGILLCNYQTSSEGTNFSEAD